MKTCVKSTSASLKTRQDSLSSCRSLQAVLERPPGVSLLEVFLSRSQALFLVWPRSLCPSAGRPGPAASVPGLLFSPPASAAPGLRGRSLDPRGPPAPARASRVHSEGGDGAKPSRARVMPLRTSLIPSLIGKRDCPPQQCLPSNA